MAATANTHDILGEATLGELEATLRGQLVRLADPDYDQARAVWGRWDGHTPLLSRRSLGIYLHLGARRGDLLRLSRDWPRAWGRGGSARPSLPARW
jgi:hypothetical protein